ncbi:hypothetical protein FH972_016235 [Carpinus fangiana]|uniref:Starch synthase, chloroplastic/amyloplastic n=1 Tax=Carpinus fangiana TaxID=176857 RepID=A0A5N6RI17_9ROSI|nr:hypothetical protein FH972_016235 [Carpinus fangiana]
MESLPMTTKYLSCKSSSSSSSAVLAKFNHFRVIGQVGFAPLWRRRSGRGCLRLRASVSGDTIGGSQDGPSAVEDDKEKKGLILGTERDGSGSVIGFHLIPQSGEVGVSGVNDSFKDITTNSVEEAVDIEGEEKAQTRVTHNIVFVTAEAAPYSKTDKNFASAVDLDCCIKIYCFEGVQEVGFYHEYRAGVDWVFVDHPSYHRPGNPYGDKYGAFGDNQFRFTLLGHAACEAPLVLPLGGFTYGEKCLFLVNDWHASLVPVLLAGKYRPYGVYKDARSILVIHNLSHQGVEPALTYKNLGLPPEWYEAVEWVFPTWARAHALDTGQAVNLLKGAIVTADRLLTVSQGYAWEITTDEGGYGLHGLLSSRKSVLNGITNGIDVAEWDPSSDEHIACNYSVKNLRDKVQCKIDLQKELGLPIRPDCPLIGFIGRLDYQKGIDLIRLATPEIMEDDVQFVMLGSGNPQYEDWMRETESVYKDKFRGWVGFNVPISHKITAGCDILLMPSRFEPCGLNQLYAMRYGTVPVVHGTGGLKDTVQNFNPYAQEGSGEGTGWAFSPLTKESMLVALKNAALTYRDYKPSWEGLMKRGMQRNCTWENAAIQYEQVFEWARFDPPYVN